MFLKEGCFGNPQIALEAVNESYFKALELGYDNRNEQWAIYRVQISKDYDESGDYLGSCRTERLWYKVSFSEINGQYIMNI